MIDIKDGKWTYSIRWSHHPEKTGTLVHKLEDGSVVSTQFHGRTECTVWQMNGSEPIKHTGFATCSVDDAYSKEKGRKVSLTRAIEDLPKETRKVIWEGYFSRK